MVGLCVQQVVLSGIAFVCALPDAPPSQFCSGNPAGTGPGTGRGCKVGGCPVARHAGTKPRGEAARLSVQPDCVKLALSHVRGYGAGLERALEAVGVLAAVALRLELCCFVLIPGSPGGMWMRVISSANDHGVGRAAGVKATRVQHLRWDEALCVAPQARAMPGPGLPCIEAKGPLLGRQHLAAACMPSLAPGSCGRHHGVEAGLADVCRHGRGAEPAAGSG